MSEKEILNPENEDERANEGKRTNEDEINDIDYVFKMFKSKSEEERKVLDIDSIFEIFNKKPEVKNEQVNTEYYDKKMMDFLEKNSIEARKREQKRIEEQRKIEEERNKVQKQNNKKKISAKPKTMTKGRKFALTLAGLTLVTALAGVSAKMLEEAHRNQIDQIKTEAYNEGVESGKSLFEEMKESATEQDIKVAISDAQHRENVNKKLNIIKQEIADSNGINVADIRIDTNRDEKGNLTIEVIDQNGEKINISDSMKNQIVSFIEDYQNPMLDGNVTEQQKEALKEELDTALEENIPTANLPANETEDPER